MKIGKLKLIFFKCIDFYNRVWRYRGGRDGHETLQQFMAFLGQGVTNKPVYPGIALFVVPASLDRSYNVDMARDFGV